MAIVGLKYLGSGVRGKPNVTFQLSPRASLSWWTGMCISCSCVLAFHMSGFLVFFFLFPLFFLLFPLFFLSL